MLTKCKQSPFHYFLLVTKIPEAQPSKDVSKLVTLTIFHLIVFNYHAFEIKYFKN